LLLVVAAVVEMVQVEGALWGVLVVVQQELLEELGVRVLVVEEVLKVVVARRVPMVQVMVQLDL
jgi:hypothetical protein